MGLLGWPFKPLLPTSGLGLGIQEGPDETSCKHLQGGEWEHQASVIPPIIGGGRVVQCIEWTLSSIGLVSTCPLAHHIYADQ